MWPNRVTSCSRQLVSKESADCKMASVGRKGECKAHFSSYTSISLDLLIACMCVARNFSRWGQVLRRGSKFAYLTVQSCTIMYVNLFIDIHMYVQFFEDAALCHDVTFLSCIDSMT